jgi:hypothetical protein
MGHGRIKMFSVQDRDPSRRLATLLPWSQAKQVPAQGLNAPNLTDTRPDGVKNCPAAVKLGYTALNRSEDVKLEEPA